MNILEILDKPGRYIASNRQIYEVEKGGTIYILNQFSTVGPYWSKIVYDQNYKYIDCGLHYDLKPLTFNKVNTL